MGGAGKGRAKSCVNTPHVLQAEVLSCIVA